MFKVRVLTPAYLLTGEVEENSAFLGWLNNKDKLTLDLHNAEGLVLNPDASLPGTATQVATIHKRQVVGVEMLDQAGQQSINTSGRSELAVLYTARFVIQANLYPPGEMGINKIPDVTKSNFVVTTQAKLHSLLPIRNLPSLEASLLLLNWGHIDFYHPAA
ncbi:MAG: hypothetical protein AAF485_10655 [Chloroflexota bacterium]